MQPDLLAVLWCPADHGTLDDRGDAAVCTTCDRRYPVIDGVLSFLVEADMDELDRAEQADRDAEADWYDSIWPEYIDRIELPAHAERLGTPDGVVLDLGSGPGRITEYLAKELHHPTIGLDYSLASLRLLARRCEGLPVLAVHADGRALPIRDGAVAGATSGQCYEHLRPDVRAAMLREAARVLRRGAPLAVTTFNYNLTFRLWKLKGNEGARGGEHMYGSNFYYVRQTPKEFRAELTEAFEIEELAGIRTIPARSMFSALRKVGGAKVADRFMGMMVRRGYKLDRLLERTPLGKVVGFLLLAKVSVPVGAGPAAASSGDRDPVAVEAGR